MLTFETPISKAPNLFNGVQRRKLMLKGNPESAQDVVPGLWRPALRAYSFTQLLNVKRKTTNAAFPSAAVALQGLPWLARTRNGEVRRTQMARLLGGRIAILSTSPKEDQTPKQRKRLTAWAPRPEPTRRVDECSLYLTRRSGSCLPKLGTRRRKESLVVPKLRYHEGFLLIQSGFRSTSHDMHMSKEKPTKLLASK